MQRVFIEWDIWANMKDLANHKARNIHALQLEFMKWAALDLCEPITRLFNLVAKEGIPASWNTNITQMIVESNERNSMNYRTTMLNTISGKLYGFALEKKLVDGRIERGHSGRLSKL